jgi:hypothetical protein
LVSSYSHFIEITSNREDGSINSGRGIQESKIDTKEDEKEDSLSDLEDDPEEETPKPHNPLLVVTNVMSREEIELKETVFRYLLFCCHFLMLCLG